MGCCASKQQDLFIDIPRTVSTTDTWALRQKSFQGGCKLLPFTAACPASYPYQSLTRVVLGDDHLFAALWEGHGGSQAARHCVSNCYELLLQCMQSNPDPCWALRQTTQQLDKSYLASPDLPDTVKAGVGATGIMLFINTRTNQCCVARLGDSMPFVAASKGSFNTTSVEVKPLTSSKGHRVLLSEMLSRGQQQQAHSSTDDGGLATYTHAVGLGYGKSGKLQQAWLQQQEDAAALKLQLPQLPFISNSCEVTMSQLCSSDETLVLASEGLLQVLPPHEVGLLLHHFNAARLNALKQALTAATVQQEAAAAAAKGGRGRGSSRAKARGGNPSQEVQPDEAVAAAGKAARYPNVASIVMHHALLKALGKHNLAMDKHQQQLLAAGELQRQELLPELSYEELTHLPLVVDAEAFRPAGPKGSSVRLHLPKHYPAGGLSRRDVHSDMGLVVIALNWPRCQESQPLPSITRAGRTVRPDAQYRWQLLRLAVKFHMAYRRALRSRWYELAEAAEAAAEEAARQAEVHAWKSQGAAVKVNLAGDVMDTATPMRMRHSPIKPPLQLSPKKRPSPMRSSGIGSCSSSSTHTSGPLAAGAGAGATPIRSSAAAGAAFTTPAAATAAKHTPGSRGADSTPTAAAAATPSSTGKPKAPAPLQIYEREIGCDDNASDIDSPSRLDSPSKAAKSAAAAAAAPAVKKQLPGSSSPTKAYSKSQSLSLRGSRSTAASAGASPQAADAARAAGPAGYWAGYEQQGSSGSPSAGITAEASWGTASRASTPGQQQLRSSRSSAGPQHSAGKAGLAAAAGGAGGGSPAKRGVHSAGSGRPVEDYSGYHASGYGAGVAAAGGGATGSRGGAGGGGSPTKLNRAGKLSLRKPASHY
ncbi:hypothetical protein OEZ85_005977 [Tetradesmus obliquus]|uniref:PPM-type phosphatase domain-containing protein n=1 Tax=Tetradesmus obliquus TaxID=3088 RepID=A0ABY8UFT5_TETOB|nr:hypothetical protein OEZ85_005977 [Tetradesmus obliquus]